MTQLNFNASNVAPQASLEPIPKGNYVMAIVASSVKPTKDTKGQILHFECKVMEGEYAGRVVFDRLNWVNDNPAAVEIGQKRLSAYCHAIGVLQVNDTTDLHNKPFLATVKIRAGDDNYDANNEIKNIAAIGSGGAPAAASGGPTWGATDPAAKPAPTTTAPTFGAPAATPAPAAPPVAVAAPPAPVAAAPVQAKRMTGKAPGVTLEQFLATPGWTEQMLIDQGYMVIETTPAAPVMPTAGGAPKPWEN